MKIFVLAVVGMLVTANVIAQEDQPDPPVDKPLKDTSEKVTPPLGIGRPVSLPGNWPDSNPWLFLWNHWATTGGAGPNNEPAALLAKLPDAIKLAYQAINENCIAPGEPCVGVELPCCSENYLSRRFCSFYANRCL